jgi:hypothetical protein
MQVTSPQSVLTALRFPSSAAARWAHSPPAGKLQASAASATADWLHAKAAGPPCITKVRHPPGTGPLARISPRQARGPVHLVTRTMSGRLYLPWACSEVSRVA